MEMANKQLNKIKDFLLKNRLILFFVITGLLTFLSNFSFVFIYIEASLIILYYVFCDFNEMLCCSVYLVCLSSVGYYYVTTLIFGLLIACIKYFIKAGKGQEKFYILPLIITTILIFGSALISLNKQTDYFGINLILILFTMYLAFVNRKNLNPETYFKCLIYGIFSSLIVGLISHFIPNSTINIFNSVDSAGNGRLKLLTYHENHLAFLCLISISYLIYKIVNKKGILWQNILFSLCLSVIGIFTLSKAFLLMLVLYLVYLFVFLNKKHKKQSIKIIIPTFIVIAIFALIGNNYILKILSRFLNSYENGTLIQKITTGRSTIWQSYINEMSTSVFNFLFGKGLFALEPCDIGSHSVIVYLLYHFGILGTSLFVYLCFVYVNLAGKNFNLRLKNCLPLVTFLLISLEENLFTERYFFIIIYAILLVLSEKNNIISKKE